LLGDRSRSRSNRPHRSKIIQGNPIPVSKRLHLRKRQNQKGIPSRPLV